MDTEGSNADVRKIGEIRENLENFSKQLALIQGFIESKFGIEFTKFCQQLSENSPGSDNQTYAVEQQSSTQDEEDYDKMPNLVSQESPSRTLGYVTVPLRQTNAGVPTPKLHPAPASNTISNRRERSSVVKEELQSANDNDDMMYQLHNFPDLLVENNGEMDTNETPEFLELELDPSALLRGEPPALHPMFADSGQDALHGSNNNACSKRSNSRQGSTNFSRFDIDAHQKGNNSSRRASISGHESTQSQKKFDCLICGIKFEYAETLKSHMDSHSHAGCRNIRSNSEDQPGMGSNANAPPLPKLMPRPIIPTSTPASDISPFKLESNETISLKSHRIKKIPSSPGSPSSSESSGTSKSGALKRRKRYNQSRPCSLVCPECGLKIRDRSRLIEHIRGHTGERPFQCSFCDKSYTRKDVLKTHVLKMHGEAAAYHASKSDIL